MVCGKGYGSLGFALTYPRLCNLRICTWILDAQKTKLHPDIDDVAQGVDLNILRDNTECDHLAAASETREGDEIPDLERCHCEWVGSIAR